MAEARLLIIEDNDEIAQMLVLFFGARGYKLGVAPDGASALQSVREALPDLLLLDVGLPDIDGFELLNQMRQSPRTRYIPAIFLTQRSKKIDKLTGLQLGADDFISKPFDIEELYLRVQNSVARARRENLNDPQTGLPTGSIVREEVARAHGKASRAVLQFRFRHLSEFRDQYGALAGSDLLRYTALMLNRVLNTLGRADDFLGRPDDESFTIICGAERADLIRRTVLERFEADAAQHYALGERMGDKIKVHTLSGKDVTLPLVRLESA
ncbi:MAG: response regulator [Anaerolineales bacterium]